jgi:ADP-ribose pyrophosphatase YjhB (NUDIX family)
MGKTIVSDFMKEYYFIEKEGRVFTVKRNDKITLPTSKEEVDFPFGVVSNIIKCNEYSVNYCITNSKRSSPNWIFKDDICVMENVDRVLRKSANMSYVRPAVLGVIRKGKKFLVVKSTRGTTKGFWSFPGGFVNFMEKPEDALRREIKEETNLNVKEMKLFKIYNHKFENPNINHQYYMYGFVYICDIDGDPEIVDDEIGEIKYLSSDEILVGTRNEFVKIALGDLGKLS